MRKARGARTPHFGRLLAAYRNRLGKRRSLAVVVRLLADVGVRTGTTTIFNYESGRPPDAGVLWGLAKIYGEDFLRLCAVLAEELGGSLDATPAVAPRPLDEVEQRLVSYYREAEANPRSQRAMLAACAALAGVQAHEDDVVG